MARRDSVLLKLVVHPKRPKYFCVRYRSYNLDAGVNVGVNSRHQLGYVRILDPIARQKLQAVHVVLALI